MRHSEKRLKRLKTKVIEAREEGATYEDLRKRFGVSPSTISKWTKEQIGIIARHVLVERVRYFLKGRGRNSLSAEIINLLSRTIPEEISKLIKFEKETRKKILWDLISEARANSETKEKKTFEEIGKSLGISKQRVHQIINKWRPKEFSLIEKDK